MAKTTYSRPSNVKPKRFTNPEPCGWCGRPAKKDTDRHYGREPYAGNLIVLRTERTPQGYIQSIWDGETYVHPYGYFCSQPCGMRFAHMMYRDHLRRDND